MVVSGSLRYRGLGLGVEGCEDSWERGERS